MLLSVFLARAASSESSTRCNTSALERNSAGALESVLNNRFAEGRPSNRLHAAGVVMRAFDADPRLNPPSHPRWVTQGPLAGVASASLVNARAPFLFAAGATAHLGVVIASHVAHATLACEYPGDAASVYVRCDPTARPTDGCVPGCVGIRLLPGATPSTLTRQHWCAGSGSSGSDGQCDGAGCGGGCAWPPEALHVALQLHENTTRGVLNGCPSSRHRWCGCVLHALLAIPHICPPYFALQTHAHRRSSSFLLPLSDALDMVDHAAFTLDAPSTTSWSCLRAPWRLTCAYTMRTKPIEACKGRLKPCTFSRGQRQSRTTRHG